MRQPFGQSPSPSNKMAVQNILLVDDSKTETLVLSELLTSAGYSVATAGTAEEAWNHLQTDLPDLILLDVVMPGANGFEFTRRLQRTPQYAGLPIFLCSSKNSTSDRLWGLRQGATGYFTKPVDAADLLAAIQALK